MALAGRSTRSGGSRRLLLGALVVTILVVLLDASIKSRNPAPAQTLAAQAWVDRVLPVVRSSAADGAELADLRTSGVGQPAARITSTLDRIAADAQTSYRTVVALGTPAGTAGAPGLLQTALLVRAQGAAALDKAITSVLAAPAAPAGTTDPAVTAAAQAFASLQVGDRAYGLFTTALPTSVAPPFAASTWVTDPTAVTAVALQPWLAALRAATNLAPVHQLVIDAISTNPPPVGLAGGVQDIPPARALSVTVVVGDAGNQPESNLTVTAAISPAAPGTATSVRQFVSLTAGSASTVTLGPLLPPSATPATLTVTVTPPAGSSTAPATSTLTIEVAAPPPPSTTTTVPTSTSTSLPGTSGSSGSKATTTTTTPVGG